MLSRFMSVCPLWWCWWFLLSWFLYNIALHCHYFFPTYTLRMDYFHPPLLLLNSALRVTQRYTPLQFDWISAFTMAVYLSFGDSRPLSIQSMRFTFNYITLRRLVKWSFGLWILRKLNSALCVFLYIRFPSCHAFNMYFAISKRTRFTSSFYVYVRTSVVL